MKNRIFACFVGILVGIVGREFFRARNSASELLGENHRLTEENRKLSAAVSFARSREQSPARPEVNASSVGPIPEQAYEDALAQWLARVKKLRDFLLKHPEYRIPQMDALTADQWLDVTKGREFETEADYRKALGRLRGMARQTVANEVGKALVRAIQDNQGRLPEDVSAFAPYLPAGIAETLAKNPSGKVLGLKTNDQFFVVDKPVDIWDATLLYNKDGNWGARAGGVKGEDAIQSAISAYTTATGQRPRSVSDIMSYRGVKDIPPSIADELFAALNTKP